jgi:hypothetical protein
VRPTCAPPRGLLSWAAAKRQAAPHPHQRPARHHDSRLKWCYIFKCNRSSILLANSRPTPSASRRGALLPKVDYTDVQAKRLLPSNFWHCQQLLLAGKSSWLLQLWKPHLEEVQATCAVCLVVLAPAVCIHERLICHLCLLKLLLCIILQPTTAAAYSRQMT